MKLLVAVLFLVPTLVSAAFGDVAILQVFFDPDGSDTGVEYVVVKNFGSSTTNLAGWELYPDGVGYFVFPAFTLNAGAEVKIHLRAEGTTDDKNLFHSSATANMGNSSGAVALFSASQHTSDTIMSYVRYHKAGSTEKKTWETTAASAGIWTAGTFVDIGSGAEGKMILLTDVAGKKSPNGWELQTLSSTDTTEPDLSDAASPSRSSSENFSVNSGSISDPGTSSKIKAYAGTDRTVIAGSSVVFAGNTEGLDGEPLASARFLWNFGDGAYDTGQKVEHIFAYPGTYTVALEVSLGNFSGSDRAEIRVIPNPVFISEIMPGENGWVELKNDSSRLLDISGMGMAFTALQSFFFPSGTMIAPHAFVVVGASTLGFTIPSGGETTLMYANGSRMFTSAYTATNLKIGESIARSDDSEWIAGIATPGEEIQKSISPKKAKSDTSIVVPVNTVLTPSKTLLKQANTASVFDAKNTQDNSSIPWYEYGWLFGGLGVGGLFGIALIFIKKKYLVVRQ